MQVPAYIRVRIFGSRQQRIPGLSHRLLVEIKWRICIAFGLWCNQYDGDMRWGCMVLCQSCGWDPRPTWGQWNCSVLALTTSLKIPKRCELQHDNSQWITGHDVWQLYPPCHGHDKSWRTHHTNKAWYWFPSLSEFKHFILKILPSLTLWDGVTSWDG